MPVAHRLHARCGAASCSHHEGSGSAAARPFAFPHSPRHFERDRPFLVEHLSLDLALEVAKKSVVGIATLHLRRIDPDADEVHLDAVAFDLRSVRLDGGRATHRYDGRVITVSIPKGVDKPVITVAYGATPRRGLYFLEPDEHVPDRPRQVWSQCQEEDARYFLPCLDKPHVKMTTEMAVRVPNGWTVLSNGELVSKETPRTGAWRFHWKMDAPHPSYLLTLVAGQFVEIEENAKRGAKGTVPVSYLVPKGRVEDGVRTFARTPKMIEHFGSLLGTPYPWNKYAQVVVSDFIFGGMENTTATTLYEHVLLDSRASLDITSDDLIAHELAHQWFGDFVTCRDWSEGWLNEGFATYFEHVWREKLLGRDEYEYGVKGDLEAYLSEATGRYRRPVVCQDYDSPLDLFDRHLYEKGGLVLHTLRAEVGDALFWKGVQLYLHRHARSVVETRDLMRAMEEVSGRSLGRFFEQAIYKPGHPECDVQVSWEKKVLTVAVKQHQATTDGVPAHFEFPVVLEIHDEGEGRGKAPRREKLLVTQKNDTFAVPCEARPAFVVVDPEMRILGDVHTKAPNDMLRAQLVKAPTARGRWLAAQGLASSDDPTTIAALSARLHDDGEMWCVRAECADALGRLRAKEAFEALRETAGTSHPKVRRAVAAALGRFRTDEAEGALRPRALSDPSYLVEAEAARSLGKTKRATAYEVLVEVAARPSWADVVAVGAIDGLAALRDDRATPNFLSWTKYGRPTRMRRAAILGLPKIDDGRKAREALEDLLDDSDPHLRIDVARALAEIGDTKARPALRARLEIDLDARVRRRLRETLRDLGGESKKVSDQLKDDFEKLQNEHATLRARVAQLEARASGEPKTKDGDAGQAAKAESTRGEPAKKDGKKKKKGSEKKGPEKKSGQKGRRA
ncbi:MAG TPA: M1 family aminopeptidase [Polyangiaceae bacterium]|jgi:aminopeptidase N